MSGKSSFFSHISYLTLFFQNLNNEVLSNCKFGWRGMEGKYKVKKYNNDKPYKRVDYHVASLRRKILVWSLILYLTLFFQNFDNEVLLNCQFGWRGMEGEYKVEKKKKKGGLSCYLLWEGKSSCMISYLISNPLLSKP